MTASSSFIELSISRPPNFHSPLSVVKMEDVLILPWTELASSLMNCRVLATLCKPHLMLSSDSAFLLVFQPRGVMRSVAM